MTLVQINRIDEHYFVNRDETAADFDSNHDCTIYEKGAKTVSVRRGSTANKRRTVCVTVSADGSILLLFVTLRELLTVELRKNYLPFF